MTGFLRRVTGLIATAALAVAAVTAGQAAAAAAVTLGTPAGVGTPWNPPAQASPAAGNLPQLSPAGAGQGSGLAAAVRTAESSGHPVVASALTTATQLVTAQPDGVIGVKSYVLPVRVRRGWGGVPVNTTLRRAAGRLVPAAVPGDGVSFSAGGTGPVAEIWQAGGRLELWWPGRLPAPQVSGSSATYRDVLPGVSLVLTATSSSAGGFDEVLVASSAAAARRVAGVRLRVSGLRLAPAAGGGLRAPFPGGAFVSPPSRMWDSSSVQLGAPGSGAAARVAGAGLAAPGGARFSSALGPVGGARESGLGVAVSGGGQFLSLVPDAAMLASRSTRYPVYFDPDVTSQGNEQDYDPPALVDNPNVPDVNFHLIGW